MPSFVEIIMTGQVVSEKIFENGGRRRVEEDEKEEDNGQGLGAYLSYKLTCEPTTQLS